jgi:hypothetical protein
LWKPSARSILWVVQQPVFQHGAHAADAFLGRLEHQLDRAGELRCQVLQHRRDAEQRRGVDVVAAGVHQALVLAGERQAGAFLDRQRVHVGADRQHLAGAAALIRPTTPVLPMPVWWGMPRRVSSRGDDAGGADFLEAELGVGVDVAADFDQGGFDPLGDRRGWRWSGRWAGFGTLVRSLDDAPTLPTGRAAGHHHTARPRQQRPRAMPRNVSRGIALALHAVMAAVTRQAPRRCWGETSAEGGAHFLVRGEPAGGFL